MRRNVVLLALCAVAVIGYLVWPIVSIGRLARALEAGDVATAMTYVNAPEVRRSLAEQVVQEYAILSGKAPSSPLLLGIVTGAAVAAADPILADLADPKLLADFLRTGWPAKVAAERPAGISGLTRANIGSVWQAYRSSKYGIRRFDVSLPPTQSPDRRFVLEFRLSQWRWKLVAVRLPQQVRTRLAQALMKANR